MSRWLVIVALLVACSPPGSGCEIAPTTGSETLHLYVSNQSFDVDPVDISVYIDDQLVVCQDFAVEGQHNWILFDIALDPGEHNLKAVGDQGKAVLTETFSLEGERWAVVDFWTEETQQLTWWIQDAPIGFA